MTRMHFCTCQLDANKRPRVKWLFGGQPAAPGTVPIRGQLGSFRTEAKRPIIVVLLARTGAMVVRTKKDTRIPVIVVAVLMARGVVGPTTPTRAVSTHSQAKTQDPSPQSGYTLKENVHLVVVPVAVKDRDGTLVDDLSKADFRVFEDGQPRLIQYFSNETTPLSTVILVDTGMSALSLGTLRSRLQSLSDSFAPDDEQALILFDNTIRLTQDFTTQGDLLAEAAKKSLSEGTGAGPSILGGPLGNPPTINGVPVDRPGTAPVQASRVAKRVDDALYSAAERLRTRALGRRRVVVILSDGVNGSDNRIPHDQVMEALAASDVTVYAVSFGSGWAIKGRDWLARVARETGGDIAYVQRRKGLDQAFSQLTTEARNAYVLGFLPRSADGNFHEIQVVVARPGVHWIARNRFLSPVTR